ncbi:MAG: HlyD family type I secretion periplasmic adaptor subunit [Rhodocyclaceae bacterium]|nr:HlyD family type I secretion periplasmic adaptor subunit [Rhodocyclaceae bacterium]
MSAATNPTPQQAPEPGATRLPSPVHKMWSALTEGFRGDGASFEHSRQLLARSVVLQELPTPGASRRIVWLLVALVATFIVWSSFVELDELAVAPGEIAPADFVQQVQHLEGGIVRAIVVRDGELVKANQVLLRLDPTAATAELDSLRARREALRLQVERLKAFAEGKALPSGRSDFAELRQDQAAILSGQSQSRETQLSVADAQIKERYGQLAALQDREVSLREQVRLLKEDMSARKPLVDKGLISRLAYLNLERQLADLQGQLAQTISQQQASRAAVDEVRSSRREIGDRLRSDALRELGGASADFAEVNERIAQAEDRVRRLALRAPVEGVVKGLKVRALGTVIAPGDIVAEVVPQEGRLIADVRISPRDIGHVKIGLPVTVKVQTFDYARHGGVRGRIEYISAASFVDDRGQPYFSARVSLDSASIGDPARGLMITPGMTVAADIKTGSKTLMAYLFKPVTNALQTAFTER